MNECIGFIKDKRDSRHLKTLECQKLKFERLYNKVRKLKVATQTQNMVTMIKLKQITPQIPNLTPITQERMKMRKAATTCESGTFQVPPDRGTIEGFVTWTTFCSGS